MDSDLERKLSKAGASATLLMLLNQKSSQKDKDKDSGSAESQPSPKPDTSIPAAAVQQSTPEDKVPGSHPLQNEETVKETPKKSAGSGTVDLSSVEFYIYDRDTDLPAKGNNIELPADEYFTLRWDATSVESEGPVVVIWTDISKSRPRRVSPDSKGREDYTCRKVGTIHFEMTQDLKDGTTRDLGKIDVKCLETR
jgi:hypothetical protein